MFGLRSFIFSIFSPELMFVSMRCSAFCQAAVSCGNQPYFHFFFFFFWMIQLSWAEETGLFLKLKPLCWLEDFIITGTRFRFLLVSSLFIEEEDLIHHLSMRSLPLFSFLPLHLSVNHRFSAVQPSLQRLILTVTHRHVPPNDVRGAAAWCRICPPFSPP